MYTGPPQFLFPDRGPRGSPLPSYPGVDPPSARLSLVNAVDRTCPMAFRRCFQFITGDTCEVEGAPTTDQDALGCLGAYPPPKMLMIAVHKRCECG